VEGGEDIIADHTQVNDVMNDTNGTNDMNRDENGAKLQSGQRKRS